MQGQEWRTSLSFGDGRPLRYRVLAFPCSRLPVFSSSPRSCTGGTRIAPAQTTVSGIAPGDSPFRVTSACPSAYLFATGPARKAPGSPRGPEPGLPRQLRLRSVARLSGRASVEDAPLHVPSSPAFHRWRSVFFNRFLQRGDAGHREGGESTSSGRISFVRARAAEEHTTSERGIQGPAAPGNTE
jgi:hypothetical protein